MIQFLNLKKQISEDLDSFSFYNTVSKTIIEFAGEQIFNDIEEFKEAYELEKNANKKTIERLLDIERFLSLIPNDYFETKAYKTAQKLIAKFYDIMPVKQGMFCSEDNDEHVEKMERIAAIQAAIIAVNEIIANPKDNEFWVNVLHELQSKYNLI